MSGIKIDEVLIGSCMTNIGQGTDVYLASAAAVMGKLPTSPKYRECGAFYLQQTMKIKPQSIKPP